MKRKNDSSNSGSSSAPAKSLSIDDAPIVLLEIEAKLIELDEPGTVKERAQLNALITLFAGLADTLAGLESEAA